VKTQKISLLILLSVFVVIQFFDPAPINPIPNPQTSILRYRPANEEVTSLLKNACYDCHSNETKYMWYAYVAPVSWYIDNHVSKGREHVNFSKWTSYTPDEHDEIIEESHEEIEQLHMPLKGYQLLHPDARLSEEERNLLLQYFKEE
jgi:hypothetical protein